MISSLFSIDKSIEEYSLIKNIMMIDGRRPIRYLYLHVHIIDNINSMNDYR